jgi:hypothetical protein
MVFRYVLWLALFGLFSCTPPTLAHPDEVGEAELTNQYDLYSSGIELVTEPADTTTIERCTENDQNECKTCLATCENEHLACREFANTELLRLECRVERDDCRKECRRNVNVLCDCK